MTLGVVLPGLYLLSAEQRARLARTLGRDPAGALLTLPIDDLGLQANDLASAAVGAVWDSWQDKPLRLTMPLLDVLVGDVISADLRGPIRRSLHETYKTGVHPMWTAALLSSTPSSWLGWPGVGLRSALQLLAAAIEAVIACAQGKPLTVDSASAVPRADSAASDPASRDSAAVQLIPLLDLSLFAAWAGTEHGAESFAEAFALLESASELPPEVAAATTRLQLVDLRALGAANADRYNVRAALRRILASLDKREALVARERFLQADPRRRRTLEGLRLIVSNESGDRLVTRERVRQIELNATAALRAAQAESQNSVAVRVAQRLRDRLGVAAPINDLAAAFKQTLPLGFDESSDLDDPELRLLLYLAGPYARAAGDWLILETQRDLEAATQAVLLSAAAKDALGIDAAVELLSGFGLREEYAPLWIGQLRQVRSIEGQVIPWTGTLADKAVWILRLSGEPMTPQNIVAAIGAHHSPASLANVIGADARFVRVEKQRYGLTAWKLERYDGIVTEIMEELDAHGGIVAVDDLVEALAGQFGVSPNSVRSYASGHWFVSVGDGRIRRRQLSDPFAPPPKIEATPGCFQLRQGWAIRLEVTNDTLRGSGTTVRAGVAGHLGLLPGSVRDLASAVGPVNFNWTGLQPTIGSHRDLAQSVGCACGDYLFLEIAEPDRNWLTPLRFGSRPEDPDGAFVQIGANPEDWAGDLVAALAFAVGLDPDIAGPGEVRARLLIRGEPHLAALLPADDGRGPDGLLSALGL